MFSMVFVTVKEHSENHGQRTFHKNDGPEKDGQRIFRKMTLEINS
jgi:hypothetical protein